CAGCTAESFTLLSGADPTLVSPGCSHSSPTSDSQPSGFCNPAARFSRNTAISFCQPASCACTSVALAKAMPKNAKNNRRKVRRCIEKVWREPQIVRNRVEQLGPAPFAKGEPAPDTWIVFTTSQPAVCCPRKTHSARYWL